MFDLAADVTGTLVFHYLLIDTLLYKRSYSMASPDPKVVLVFSGKRKSGKDFVTDLLKMSIGGDTCVILRLSGPLKSEYAKLHNLDYEKLLSASTYKETYREDMVRWGEEKRIADPGIFCRLAAKGMSPQYKVWLISDARRKTDVAYFKETYGSQTLTVRVQADVEIRQSRGYSFTKGVDDAETECGLDDGVEWDFVITNNGDAGELNTQLEELIERIQSKLEAEMDPSLL